MNVKIILFIVGIFLLGSGLFSNANAQTGQVFGIIKDSSDGSPLPAATIRVEGTSQGAVSDIRGNYFLDKLQAGDVELILTYVGYKTKTVKINVKQGKKIELNITMEPEQIFGKEVVVTGQLRGQNAAINQQINSNSIINVLSKERIQELPDQNAAETISRLPGISVQRSGGEGQKVIVRGLDPKYTTINVNGVKIPSLDEVNRSTDLSSISSEMLEGIEVLKSYTADQDGDAVGGTVNFTMKKAPDSFSSQVRMQGGYNDLQKEYGDYKASASLSNRFFDGALGLIATGNIERSNRSSQQLNASYLTPRPLKVAPDLNYTIDIRKRYGASVEADLKLMDNFNLYFTAFRSNLSHNPIEQKKSFNPSAGSVGLFTYTDGEKTDQLDVLNLGGDNNISLPIIGLLNFKWGVSSTRAEQNSPLRLSSRFYHAAIPGLNYNSGPDSLFATWKVNVDTTYLNRMIADTSNVLDKNITYHFNAKTNFNFGSWIVGVVKFGGKFNHKSRDRDKSELIADNQLGIQADWNYLLTHPTLYNPYLSYRLTLKRPSLSNFVQGQTDNFLNGRFAGWPTINGDAVHKFWDTFKNYRFAANDKKMFTINPAIIQQAYTAAEDISAGYVETQINLGQDLMISLGARYEYTKNEFKSVFGDVVANEDEIPTFAGAQDTLGTSSYGEWLTAINLRYTPINNIILRFSATKTLSRPDYFDLVPYQNFSENIVRQGNPTLKHVTSFNYDVGASILSNYGFFSTTCFYKELDNVMYTATRLIKAGTPRSNKYYGFFLYQTINAAKSSNLYGIELEVQANFLMLPSPFNGFILNGNISLIKSETIVPFININNALDTTRTVSMPGQTNTIANLTIGYEKGDFSGRISLIYQGKSLYAVGLAPDLDAYNSPYYRWDLSLQQKLFHGLSLYFNIYNLSNVKDMSYLGSENLPTAIQEYGLNGSLGIQYRIE